MANSILNSDDGSVSGSAGLKFTAGDDGVLKIQNNGTDALTVSDAGVVTFAQQSVNPVPAFHVYLGTTQTLTSNVAAVIKYDTKQFDTNNWFNTSTHRFTPQIAGYYQLNATVTAQATGMTRSLPSFYFNETTSYRVGYLPPFDSATDFCSFSGATVLYFNGSTDYIVMLAFVTASSGLSLSAALSGDNYFSGFLVRAA